MGYNSSTDILLHQISLKSQLFTLEFCYITVRYIVGYPSVLIYPLLIVSTVL